MSAQSNRDRRMERGFTLLELLIVVALIAILACLAIPSMISAMDKGKRNATIANIRQLGHAVEAYAIENNRYPQAGSIEELARVLESGFLKKPPRVDGWGNPLVYECEASGQAFSIVAVGKNGLRESSRSSPGASDDIVFADGRLLLEEEDEKS